MASKIQDSYENPLKKRRISKEKTEKIKCVYKGEVFTCNNKDEFNIYTSIENKQYHIAQTYIKQYILYLKKNKMYSDISPFMCLLAETHYEIGNFDIARKHLENLKNLFIKKKKYYLIYNPLIRIFVLIFKEQGSKNAFEFLNNEFSRYMKFFDLKDKLEIIYNKIICLCDMNKNIEAFKLSKNITNKYKYLMNKDNDFSVLYGYILFYQFYSIDMIISNDYSKENLEYVYDLFFKEKISNKSEFVINFMFSILKTTILLTKHYDFYKLEMYSECIFKVARQFNIEDELKKFLVYLKTFEWFNEILSEKKNLIKLRHFLATLQKTI